MSPGSATRGLPRGGGLLVLGGSGFLGAQLVRAAARSGEPCTSASRTPPPIPGPPAGFAHVAFDAEERAALDTLLDRVRPACVVSPLALSRMGDCAREPARAEELNATFPGRLARACRERGLRLVHVSTDLVFGDPPRQPGGHREEDPPAPRQRYGATKAEGEERVLEAYPGALVVRLPLLFGDSFGRGLGASDALLAELAGGGTPTLFEDEHRTPLDVGVAARALLELAWGDEAGRLHVAGPRRMSRFELGQVVLRSAGERASPAAAGRMRRGRRADLGLEDVRPADVSLDASRARARLVTELADPESSLARSG